MLHSPLPGPPLPCGALKGDIRVKSLLLIVLDFGHDTGLYPHKGPARRRPPPDGRGEPIGLLRLSLLDAALLSFSDGTSSACRSARSRDLDYFASGASYSPARPGAQRSASRREAGPYR
jgi:hypothetical protein